MAGPISGTLGRFYSHGTVRTAFALEACSQLGALNYYQIDDTTKRWWRPESPITVYTASGASTVEAAASTFLRRDLGGVVEFKAAIPPASTVLVSGTYYPMLHIGGFKQWDFNLSREAIDVTRQGVAWREFQPSVGAAEASAAGFWLDDFFFGTVDPAVKWLAVFYVDVDNDIRYEAQTFVTGDSLSTDPSKVAEESVAFRCTEIPRYYAS